MSWSQEKGTNIQNWGEEKYRYVLTYSKYIPIFLAESAHVKCINKVKIGESEK